MQFYEVVDTVISLYPSVQFKTLNVIVMNMNYLLPKETVI